MERHISKKNNTFHGILHGCCKGQIVAHNIASPYQNKPLMFSPYSIGGNILSDPDHNIFGPPGIASPCFNQKLTLYTG